MQVRTWEYSGKPDAGDAGGVTPDLHAITDGEPAMEHNPVLVSPVLTFLVHDNSPLVILDGTVGAGGHARAVLDRFPNVSLIGIDRDTVALEIASKRLRRFGNRVTLVQGVFSDVGEVLSGVGRIDGVLLDLGISSMQLNEPSRGFSYSADGVLDMRMGSSGRTAREWIEGGDVTEIATVLRRYGEVRRAKRIARAIKEAASAGSMLSTGDLKAAVRHAIGAAATPSELSRVFQAIRIQTNDELEMLDRFLSGIIDHVKPGGRIVVISYHSLEDRLVKSFFKFESATCICPPGLPICSCGHTPRLKVLTRRVVKPSTEEITSNARSRSARLRAAEVNRTGTDR